MEYNLTERPEIIIVEQPQPRSLRFRYHCENRGSSFSPILGIESSETERSFPTVEVTKYQRRVKLVVHCVTSEGPPFLHHPHKLVGQNCENGVCVAYIGPETDMRYSLSNVGIQCVRKQDIGEELKTRLASCSNPCIGSSDYPTPINVNSLRLCFQAFLLDESNKFDCILPPVVSNVIFDKKSCPELKICNISDSEAPVRGGKKIILLCEKVHKTDIQVRFFKEMTSHPTWEAFGSFSLHDVHKQVAIVFFTPAYYDLGITAPVTVNLQLRSRSLSSKPIEFTFHPVENARPDELPPQPQEALPPFQSLQHRFKSSPPSNESFNWPPKELENTHSDVQLNVNSSDRYELTIPTPNLHLQCGSDRWEKSSDDNSDFNELDPSELGNVDFFSSISNLVLEIESSPVDPSRCENPNLDKEQ